VEQAKELERLRRSIPTGLPNDPGYRRLQYIRYADDFLLGFVGPKNEAEEIKQEIKNFLQKELQLELSEEKTLITHATMEKAKFLGYEISIHRCNTKITSNRRSINGNISLRMPKSFVNDRARFYMQNGKPIHRKERTHETDYSILCQYQSEYRGYVQYFKLAENICHLNRLFWIMQVSLLKTLAHKHKSSVNKMAKKLKVTTATPDGPRKCLEVIVPRENRKPLVARFGGIPLKTQRKGIIEDQQMVRARFGRNELLKRLLAQTCEQCESSDHIEVHHVRKLADLKKEGRREKPDWVKLMVSRNRKTLVLCRECHKKLHAGQPMKKPSETNYRRAV
jgi:hypothetical protein